MIASKPFFVHLAFGGLLLPLPMVAAEIEVYILGNNGKPADVYPLPQCAGDCDLDYECQEGLVCFHKIANDDESVPGCLDGEGSGSRTDYCVRQDLLLDTVSVPQSGTASPTETTPFPTDSPTPLPTTTPDSATGSSSTTSFVPIIASTPTETTAFPTESPTPLPTTTPDSTSGSSSTTSFVPIIADNDDDGEWGRLFDMEVIAIHAIYLGDGQILAYGTDTKGKQGAERYFEVWDPRTGKHSEASTHNLYRQSTKVDIFCSTVSMDVSTGNLLIMGGDDGDNNGVKNAFEFRQTGSSSYEIREHPKGDMKYARWYGSSVNLPDGRIFIVGGESGTRKVASPIPEVWSPGEGFRPLRGATVPAIGTSRSKFATKAWYYPHTYVNSSGDIIVIIGKGKNTDVYLINPDGAGYIKKIGEKPFNSHMLGPSIMYRPDSVLMLDNYGYLWHADISNSYRPRFSRLTSIGKPRTNGAMAILPDGRVAIAGGCSSRDGTGESLSTANYRIQIWDPVTNQVYDGPKQKEARLYHSTSLILPDSTVFSAGGGAPGPVRNLDGQIYTPGYLVNPETGKPATRPVIVSCPKNARAGDTIYLEVNVETDFIQRVTATKSGSMTHARNNDARWVELAFNAGSGALAISLPNRNIMIPGVWNINVIDMNGVPSVASILGINMADL